MVLQDQALRPAEEARGLIQWRWIVLDFIFNHKNSVPRASLYCVWIRAQEGENAPLIRVWIDPSMSMFDSQAKVHEPDLAASAKAEAVAAMTGEYNS